jgi:hypothetical protein
MNHRPSTLLARSIQSLLVASVLVPITSSTSMAQDAKLVSGADCSFADGPTFAAHNKFSQFQNSSGATRTVICPIVKDDIAGSVNYVQLLTSSSATFSPNGCIVTRRPANGGGLSSFPHATTQNNLNGTRFVIWSPIQQTNGTALAVQCTVPTGDTIFSVQHSEE